MERKLSEPAAVTNLDLWEALPRRSFGRLMPEAVGPVLTLIDYPADP